MAERDDAHAFGLRDASEIGDRDAGHIVDRADAVQFQRIDDKVKAVRQLLLRVDVGCVCFNPLRHR
jgi:hypothetical protein